MKQAQALVCLFLLTLHDKPLNASSCKENGAHKPDSSPSRIKKLKHYGHTNDKQLSIQEDAKKKAQIEAAASVLDANRKKPGIPIKHLDLEKLLQEETTTLERIATPSDSSQSSSEDISAPQLDTIQPFRTTKLTANNMQQIIVVEPATPKSPLSNQTSSRNSHSLSESSYTGSQSSSSSAKNNSPRPIRAPDYFLCKLPKEVYDRQEEVKREWDKANPIKPYFYYASTAKTNTETNA